MPHQSRRILAVLVAIALVITACRADTEIGSAPIAEESTEPQLVEPTTPLPEPSVAPQSSPTQTDGASPSEPTPAVSGLLERPRTFEPPPDWGDPLPIGADIVDGQLENGMRYLVRANDRPGDQAQLRLVVRAGSLNEADGTYGVAHFLEHMMFNGTERFPGNELVGVLESFGSGFGPDVNAYTSFEETVYELEVPARSEETLQLGLDVLRQWASAATLDLDAVIAERGVVREEYRRRVEPLSGRLGAEVREVLFEGTDYLGRDPIGVVEVIDSMSEQDVRDFYERWYRPEFMTIVAVGDFSTAAIEQRIIDTFASVPSSDSSESFEIDYGQGSLPQPTFDVIVDAEIVRPEVEVLWRLRDAPVQSRRDLRADFVASLALEMLDARVFEEVQRGNGLLVSAGASRSGLTSRHQLATMNARTAAKDLGAGLEQMLSLIEQARQHGFTFAEFTRALDDVRASVTQDLAESQTRQDETLARELVEYALRGVVPIASDDAFSIANEVLNSLAPADAQAFLFDVLESEPYVLVTGPTSQSDVLPEPEDLAAIYAQVVGRPVAPRAADTDERSELLVAPAGAEIVDRQRIDALETTVVTYENGARLALRRTEITENRVELEAYSPGGFFAVDGPEVPLLSSAARLVGGSGFESIDIVTLDRLLTGKIASLSTSIGRSEESLFGEASTADIETLFQLAHLQMTEPTINDLQVRQYIEQVRPLVENPNSNPPVAGDLELWSMRYGASPWFRLIPTPDDLDELDPELLLAAYKERFADAGDFVFVVVGDFDEDTVIELGARYLGTLPDSGRRETPIDRDPGLPEENLVATVAAGIGDQGRVRINWESPYPFTLEAEVAAQALELVVNARLRDRIREELGASYAPNAAISVINEPKPWVDSIIEVESDPDRVDEVSAVIREELELLRSGEIDPQYLTLAIDQLVEDYRFFSNDDWLSIVLFHLEYPDRAADEYRRRRPIAQGLTVDDLVEAATVVFPAQRSVEIRLVPANN